MASGQPPRAAVRAAVRDCLADLEPGQRVVVALSGGADSLALTAATVAVGAELGLLCEAVVIDHQLQAGSGEVAARAAEQARILGCVDARVIAVQVARGSGSGGVEAAARDARYAALNAATGVGAPASADRAGRRVPGRISPWGAYAVESSPEPPGEPVTWATRCGRAVRRARGCGHPPGAHPRGSGRDGAPRPRPRLGHAIPRRHGRAHRDLPPAAARPSTRGRACSCPGGGGRRPQARTVDRPAQRRREVRPRAGARRGAANPRGRARPGHRRGAGPDGDPRQGGRRRPGRLGRASVGAGPRARHPHHTDRARHPGPHPARHPGRHPARPATPAPRARSGSLHRGRLLSQRSKNLPRSPSSRPAMARSRIRPHSAGSTALPIAALGACGRAAAARRSCTEWSADSSSRQAAPSAR